MDLPIVELAGSPARMGEDFGEQCRDGARELYDRRLRGAIGVDDLKRFLSDHENGDDRCICRHDCDGVSTNATVVMCPSSREIHACRSQPHVGEWVTKTVG
jgi:hypothetical protein